MRCCISCINVRHDSVNGEDQCDFEPKANAQPQATETKNRTNCKHTNTHKKYLTTEETVCCGGAQWKCCGVGQTCKIRACEDGCSSVQNPLADMSRQSNFEDARGQLGGLKLAQVTFATLPILFDQTHTAHRMYLAPFILHALDIRLK